MSRWYFLQQGRPQGPVLIDHLKTEIEAGRIGPNDRLYLEGDTIWRLAREYFELKSFFKSANSEKQDPEWVLLVRKTDGTGYKQKGPYRLAQIREMLERSEIFLTDYVWRKGLKEWYRIMALPEFHVPTTRFPISIQAEPPAIQEVTREVQLPPELTPPELPQENSRQFEIEVTRQVRVGKKQPEPPATQLVQRAQLVQTYLSWPPLYRGLFVFLLFAVLGGAVYFSAYWSTFRDRTQLKMTMPDLPTVSPVAPLTAPAREEMGGVGSGGGSTVGNAVTSVVAKTAESARPSVLPKEEVRREPSYLKIFKQSEGVTGAEIQFATDASSHFAIEVRILGLGGQVLDYNSFAKTIRLKKGMPRQMKLKDYALPAGFLSVEAEIEDLKAKSTVAFKTKEDGFQKKIKQQRKRLILFHNDERRGFIKVVQRIESLSARFVQSADAIPGGARWVSFYQEWRKEWAKVKSPYLANLSPRNRNQYVHAEMWNQLKKLRQEMELQAKATNKLKVSGTNVRLDDLKNNALEISKLKGAMLQTSLWKN